MRGYSARNLPFSNISGLNAWNITLRSRINIKNKPWNAANSWLGKILFVYLSYFARPHWVFSFPVLTEHSGSGPMLFPATRRWGNTVRGVGGGGGGQGGSGEENLRDFFWRRRGRGRGSKKILTQISLQSFSPTWACILFRETDPLSRKSIDLTFECFGRHVPACQIF